VASKKKIILYVVGLIASASLVILSAIVSYQCLSILYRGISSESWHKTEGSVISTAIQRYSLARGGGTYFYAVITYSYSVDHQKYPVNFFDSRLRPKRFLKRPDAQAFIARFHPGQKISVYFNPNQPSVAILKPGLSVSAKIFYGITGFAFVILTFIFGRIVRNPLTALITEIRSNISL